MYSSIFQSSAIQGDYLVCVQEGGQTTLSWQKGTEFLSGMRSLVDSVCAEGGLGFRKIYRNLNQLYLYEYPTFEKICDTIKKPEHGMDIYCRIQNLGVDIIVSGQLRVSYVNLVEVLSEDGAETTQEYTQETNETQETQETQDESLPDLNKAEMGEYSVDDYKKNYENEFGGLYESSDEIDIRKLLQLLKLE